MPIPVAELDEAEDPVLIIKEFLKRNGGVAWTQEEISENTGLDMTTVYQICQMLRARYVESVARDEYFPIRAVERYGQTYYAWNAKKVARGYRKGAGGGSGRGRRGAGSTPAQVSDARVDGVGSSSSISSSISGSNSSGGGSGGSGGGAHISSIGSGNDVSVQHEMDNPQ